MQHNVGQDSLKKSEPDVSATDENLLKESEFEPGVSATNGTMSLAKNLQAAKNNFVKQWLAASELVQSRERRKKALEAWMASDERAAHQARLKKEQI